MSKPFTGYQNRLMDEVIKVTIDGVETAAQIEAPVGAGKSAVISRLSQYFAQKRDGKSLILESSRSLLRQMAGDERPVIYYGERDAAGNKVAIPETPEEKEERHRGEVAKWIGLKPGRLCEAADGVINQEPPVVVAMIDTIAEAIRKGEQKNEAPRIHGEALADYKNFFIDEAHHAGDDKDSDYGVVLSYFEKRLGRENMRVVSASATIDRTDGKKLDPRALGPRFSVSYPDVIREGRIISPTTIIPDIGNSRGETVREAYQELLGKGGLDLADQEIAGRIAALRDDNWWSESVSFWYRESKERPSLWFAEDIAEVKRIGEAMTTFGMKEGKDFVRVDSESEATSDDVKRRIKRGEFIAAISCNMLIEGFDVPSLALGVITKKRSPKNTLVQMYGRLMRSDDGRKNAAVMIDLGASALVHGAFEDRIALDFDRERQEPAEDMAKRLLDRAVSMTESPKRFVYWDGRNDYVIQRNKNGLYGVGLLVTDGSKRKLNILFKDAPVELFVNWGKDVFFAKENAMLGAMKSLATKKGQERGFKSYAEEMTSAAISRISSVMEARKQSEKKAPTKRTALSAGPLLSMSLRDEMRPIRRGLRDLEFGYDNEKFLNYHDGMSRNGLMPKTEASLREDGFKQLREGLELVVTEVQRSGLQSHVIAAVLDGLTDCEDRAMIHYTAALLSDAKVSAVIDQDPTSKRKEMVSLAQKVEMLIDGGGSQVASKTIPSAVKTQAEPIRSVLKEREAR